MQDRAQPNETTESLAVQIGLTPDYFYAHSDSMWAGEMYDRPAAAARFNRIMELCYAGMCARDGRGTLSPLRFGDMMRLHETAWRRWRGDVSLLEMCGEAQGEYAERLLLGDAPAGYLREPLARAADQGQADLLRDFLTAGVSPHTRDLRDVALAPSALMLSCGSDECAELLMGHDPSVIRQRDGFGARATRYAARKRRLRLVDKQLEYLKACDAVDERDCMRDTDLMWAADQGDLGFVRSLLAAGANPRLRGRDGRTAFGRAVLKGHRECADILKAAEGGAVALASICGAAAARAGSESRRAEVEHA